MPFTSFSVDRSSSNILKKNNEWLLRKKLGKFDIKDDKYCLSFINTTTIDNLTKFMALTVLNMQWQEHSVKKQKGNISGLEIKGLLQFHLAAL